MIDKTKIEALVKEVGPELYRYCLYKLWPDRDAASETMSDIWMVLCRKWDKLDQSRNIKAYLYAVADRCIMSTKRRLKKKRANEVPLDDTSLAVDQTDDYFARAKSDEEILTDFEEELPEDQRDVYHMYFIEKKTIREIASAKGITYYRARDSIETIKETVKKIVNKV